MPIDFAQLDNGDIALSGGDITIAESTLQHQRDLLLLRFGDNRTHSATGVNAEEYIGDDTDELLRSIRVQFTQDGMKVKRLGFEGTKLKTDAPYGNS